MSNSVVDALVTITILPASIGVAILLQWLVLKAFFSLVTVGQSARPAPPPSRRAD